MFRATRFTAVARAEALRLYRYQVLQNFAHMPNGPRIMSCVVKESRVAIGYSVCNCFSQMDGESAILFTMPQSNRDTHVFNGNPPRLRVNLRVSHRSFSRSSPCPPLAFENSFECRRVAQAFSVTGAQQQHF